MSRINRSRLTILALLAISAFAFAQATRPAGPQRWEEAIAKFEEQDRQSPPPRDAVLFIGSSSIRGWRLNEHFPDLPTINRGFGGSQITDSLHFADRIVLPYRPSVIVFYAGENDIAAGKSPQEVAGDFQRFVEVVRGEMPQTQIIFIGLKPSPSRWSLIERFRETNDLIREVIREHEGISCIDVESAMLADDGHPRAHLYVADQLHMTPAGYELWARLVRPHIEAALPVAAPAGHRAPRDEGGAKALLDGVREAYANLKGLRLEGTYELSFDAAGRAQSHRAEFASVFVAPNRFRHEMTDDVLIVSAGSKAWLFVPHANRYAEAELPEEGPAAVGLSGPIEPVLREQNMSLYLALCDDAARELTGVAASVTVEPDEMLDGVAYRSLRIEQDERDLRVLIDPATHLIRRIEIDLRKTLEARDVPHVKLAAAVVDYTHVESGVAVEDAAFAWSPPAGAILARGTSASLTRPDAMALVGRPAPAFTLKDLDDKAVSLAQHRGSVVVLDFWATWCGPCRAAMPHLEQVHRDFADRGVRVFAVNLREEKRTAVNFVEQNQLTLSVLLDSSGEVAGKYAVSGIPQTVIVGKNGAVRKVIIGFGPGGEAQLREAVEQALAE